MEWELQDKGSNYRVYTTSKEFNGDLYVVTIWVDKSLKSDKFWIGVSSGKKRKHRKIFEEKEYKSKGGLKALLWIKDSIFDFPIYYGNTYNKKQYICLHWSDARRRDIYSRLERYGFQFVFEDGQKILMKKLG